MENLELGKEVVRGRDWVAGDQDGGAGNRGILVEKVAGVPACVYVNWIETGITQHHRIGSFGKYELCYAGK